MKSEIVIRESYRLEARNAWKPKLTWRCNLCKRSFRYTRGRGRAIMRHFKVLHEERIVWAKGGPLIPERLVTCKT